MALFPKIKPCPYLDRFDAIMDGEYCRMCKREVHDLTDMGDAERIAFLEACGGKACVSIRLPVRPVAAAAALTTTVALVAVAPSLWSAREAARHGEVSHVFTMQPVEEPLLVGELLPPEPVPLPPVVEPVIPLAGIIAFPPEMEEIGPDVLENRTEDAPQEAQAEG